DGGGVVSRGGGGGSGGPRPGLARPLHQRSPASSCSRRQFSSRSCLAWRSVCDGLPSLSKCLAKRPSLRAKSMKVTSWFVFGWTYQSPFMFGLPIRLSRDFTVSPARGSWINNGNARVSTASRACPPALLSAPPCSGWHVV